MERDFEARLWGDEPRGKDVGGGAVDGLSLVRQCALAGVSRSSLYYSPAGESSENLALMREIDGCTPGIRSTGSGRCARICASVAWWWA